MMKNTGGLRQQIALCKPTLARCCHISSGVPCIVQVNLATNSDRTPGMGCDRSVMGCAGSYNSTDQPFASSVNERPLTLLSKSPAWSRRMQPD